MKMSKLWVVSPRPSHEDVFVQRYDRLLGQALHIAGNSRSSAEDLVHDAFIQFTLSQPDLSTIRDLDSYLFIVLRNMHLSQVRRSSQAQFTAFSIADYDSAEIGLRTLDLQTHTLVAEELHQICHFACIRKESSKAASVLILRFFHGYYTTEIAQVIRSDRDAVDRWLLIARREVKAYLEDPHSLKLLVDLPQGGSPRISPTATPVDLICELRESIYRSRRGTCLPAKRLAKLYREPEEVSIKAETLAHIVSCPSCLDEVNKLRGLPPSSDRYPTDTLGPHRGARSGGEPMDMKTLSGDSTNQFMKTSRRRRGEVIDHQPQALSFSVNGFILGSQKVRSDLTEQILSVNIDEEINFVEVFSEQGIRLMFMGVASPATAGVEQKARLALAEGRELECALSFGSPWPTLHVTYRDRSFQTLPEKLSERSPAEDDDQDLMVAPNGPKSEGLTKRLSFPGNINFRNLIGTGIWLRPATVTALFALILAALLVFHLRAPTPHISAADLLTRAIAAEESLAIKRDQVLHRTIILEERMSEPGAVASGFSTRLLTRHRIEIWQSVEKGVTARRVYDDQGRLVAGDWARADGVQTLYHHGSKPQLRPRNAQIATRNFEDAWQLSPSAKEFATLIGRKDAARLEDRTDGYVLSYTREANNEPGVVSASLVLSRDDLHGSEQTVTIRQNNEQRVYRFVETSFERRPTSAVAPAVFDPDPELLDDTATRRHGEAEHVSPSPLLPIAPSPAVATPDLEVEVLDLLRKAKADFGEQVSVTRSSEGLLEISGLVDTANRKAEIVQVLRPVANNRAVRIDISTVAEAMARQKRQSVETGVGITAEGVEISGSATPADADLRRHFSSEDQMRAFATRVLSLSRQSLLHAAKLRQLANRFSAEDLRALSPDARAKWFALIGEHANALHDEARLLQRELSVVFAATAQGDGGSGIQVADDASLVRASVRLFELASFIDETMGGAFNASNDSTQISRVKSSQFWRSLSEAESLATRIQNVR